MRCQLFTLLSQILIYVALIEESRFFISETLNESEGSYFETGSIKVIISLKAYTSL